MTCGFGSIASDFGRSALLAEPVRVVDLGIGVLIDDVLGDDQAYGVLLNSAYTTCSG